MHTRSDTMNDTRNRISSPIRALDSLKESVWVIDIWRQEKGK